MDGRFILTGSPATVREQLASMVKELGIGILMPLFQIGSLPHHLATKSANLFATEVLPYIRKEVERAWRQAQHRRWVARSSRVNRVVFAGGAASLAAL